MPQHVFRPDAQSNPLRAAVSSVGAFWMSFAFLQCLQRLQREVIAAFACQCGAFDSHGAGPKGLCSVGLDTSRV